jgi:hypothetical protein
MGSSPSSKPSELGSTGDAMMSPGPVERRPNRLATVAAAAVAAVTVVMVVVSLLLWLAGGLEPLPVSFGRTALGVAGLVIAPLGYAALGAILAHHLPRNPTGWLFLVAGFAVGTMLPVNLLVAGVHETLRPASDTVVALAWLRNTFATPAVVTVLILAATLFPTGRPPTPRWRAALGLPLVGGALLAFSAAADPVGMVSYPSIPSPTAAAPELAGLVSGARLVGVGLLLAGAAAAVAALVSRYRRGDSALRLQLRWIILAASVTATTAIPFLLTRYVIEVSDVVGEIFAAAAQIGSVSFPAATAIAMSRHRLFDIDVLLGRTLVYVPLMAILGGLYTASIAFFQRLFVEATGGTSDIAIVLTVLMVAAAFTPVRKTLEGLVERRFPLPDADRPAEPPALSRPSPEPPTRARRPQRAAAPWALLMVAPDGTVDCPLSARRDAGDCVRCDLLQTIVHGTERSAVVCRAPTLAQSQ